MMTAMCAVPKAKKNKQSSYMSERTQTSLPLLSSPDALAVVIVVTYWLTYSWLADLTDVTLVSDDTLTDVTLPIDEEDEEESKIL